MLEKTNDRGGYRKPTAKEKKQKTRRRKQAVKLPSPSPRPMIPNPYTITNCHLSIIPYASSRLGIPGYVCAYKIHHPKKFQRKVEVALWICVCFCLVAQVLYLVAIAD